MTFQPQISEKQFFENPECCRCRVHSALHNFQLRFDIFELSVGIHPKGADPVAMNLLYVIEGWKEGLQLVGESGEIELYVPAKLAYGENGAPQGGIEPNETLVFKISVDRIGKAAPAEEEAE